MNYLTFTVLIVPSLLNAMILFSSNVNSAEELTELNRRIDSLENELKKYEANNIIVIKKAEDKLNPLNSIYLRINNDCNEDFLNVVCLKINEFNKIKLLLFQYKYMNNNCEECEMYDVEISGLNCYKFVINEYQLLDFYEKVSLNKGIVNTKVKKISNDFIKEYSK